MSGEGGRVHPALILQDKTFYVIFLVLEDIFEYFCLFFGEAKNIPDICHGRHGYTRVSFFLAGVNFLQI